jgi:glycosyltransferase involved in cell wall biosynthesis
LLSDPALRQTMGDAGRRRVEAGFSIDAYVNGVIQVLTEATQ